MDTFYFTRKQPNIIWPLTLQKGEARLITVDWSAYTGVKSTTISSASFAGESTGPVGITSQANTTKTSQAILSGSETGTEYIKATAIFANGETIIRKFLVDVQDHLSDYISDYRV